MVARRQGRNAGRCAATGGSKVCVLEPFGYPAFMVIVLVKYLQDSLIS